MSTFKKTERVPFKTPFGVAHWPYLTKADDRYPANDGKPWYKTGIVFEDADVGAFEAELKRIGDLLHGTTPYVLPTTEFFTDKSKTQLQGKGVRVKSKKRPLVFDAKRKPLPAGVVIGGGSIIRVAGIIQPYESTEKVREEGKLVTSKVYGLTLYVDQVQVRKLVEGRTDEAQFDEDAGGFEYEAEASADSFGADDDATKF